VQSQLVTTALFALALISAPQGAEPANSTPHATTAAATTALEVVCPAEVVKVTCGMAYGPAVAGEPEVSGGCPPYTVTYADVVTTRTVSHVVSATT
jgi:hypothetical protein